MTDDRERFADADHVLHGEKGAGLVSKVLYAVYLTAVLALTYAFTLLRAVLVSTDTVWVRDNLAGWRGPALAVVATVLALWGAWWLGGRRGPATPPLPWIDHVVASSIDRAITVRPWWRSALAGIVGCAAVLGGVVGGAVYAAGLAGVVAVPLGIVVGAVLAGIACWLWLTAQATASSRADEGIARGGESTLLRALGIDELRAHARRGQRLYGAVLSGDPRAARLEVAAPIRRGRARRLRAGGFVLTIVRRDLLGLRRQPGPAWAGVVLAAAGATICAETVLDPTTPFPLTAIGVVLAHLAVGQWAQGLRHASDGLSAAPVFGGSPVKRALAHSIIPALAHVLVALPVAALRWALSGAGVAALGPLLAVEAALALLLVGGHWWSAFRVSHPEAAFIPETGPIMLVIGVARPWLVVVFAGTAALQRMATLPSPWLGVGLLLAVGAGVLWRGRALAKQLVTEGR